MLQVVTPAYPAMNSMFAASPQTLKELTDEMKRANDVVKGVMSSAVPQPAQWDKLVEPFAFFRSCVTRQSPLTRPLPPIIR